MCCVVPPFHGLVTFQVSMPPEVDEKPTVRSATPCACQSARCHASPSSASVHSGCGAISGPTVGACTGGPGALTVASSIVHSAHQLSVAFDEVNEPPPIAVPAAPTLAPESAEALETPLLPLDSCRCVIPDGTPVIVPLEFGVIGPSWTTHEPDRSDVPDGQAPTAVCAPDVGVIDCAIGSGVQKPV